MADYEATARSNYFRVKDEAAFLAWAQSLELEVVCDEEGIEGREQAAFMIYPEGPWPIDAEDPQTGEAREVDVAAELSRHLHEDDVAVLMEVGHERHRYVGGIAVAVNARGECVRIALEDIYERARNLGKNLTPAEL